MVVLNDDHHKSEDKRLQVMVGLSKEVVNEMAINLSKLFKHNVNIIDRCGTIIGSGEEENLGKHHPYAHAIINDGIKEYKVFQAVEGMVEPGIHVPLYANGKIIGVAEINGEPENVDAFSTILKVSVESMINQKIVESKKSTVKHYEREVVLDILYNLEAFEDIEKRLEIIGFEKQKYNLLVKIEFDYKAAKRIFEDISYIKAEEHDETYFILTCDSEECLYKIRDELVNENVHSIISEVVEFKMLKDEFQIIKYIEQHHKDDTVIYFTKNYKIHSFLETIDYGKYDFYEAKNILDYEYLVETFNAYIENNLSLIHTSEKLFIHINTLKYRLKRIEEMTGCCLHNVDDILRIRLSILALTNQKK